MKIKLYTKAPIWWTPEEWEMSSEERKKVGIKLVDIEYNTDKSAEHPFFLYKDDDIVRYSFEKRRVQDKEPVYNKLRVHSIAEQSTRFCNYSKDKFDNQVTFCKPAWIKLNLGNYEMIFNPEKELEHTITGDGYIRKTSEIADDVSFLEDCLRAEMKYLSLIKVFNYAPQQAREVLPLCTATEIIHTAFEDDWKYFFDLRYFESTGKVHPNMLELSTIMKEECEKAKIWDSIITSKRHI